MSPCCPSCGSAQSLGMEAASICTECVNATGGAIQMKRPAVS